MRLRYRQLQIIKHSLQHYIKRDGASEDDLVRERNLLNKISDEVNEIKERHQIK